MDALLVLKPIEHKSAEITGIKQNFSRVGGRNITLPANNLFAACMHEKNV